MRNASRTTNNEQLTTREYAQCGSLTTTNEKLTTRERLHAFDGQLSS